MWQLLEWHRLAEIRPLVVVSAGLRLRTASFNVIFSATTCLRNSSYIIPCRASPCNDCTCYAVNYRGSQSIMNSVPITSCCGVISGTPA